MSHIYNEAGLDSFTQQLFFFFNIKHVVRHSEYREQDT